MTEIAVPPATLHAYFSYRDAPAALGWLERAFGFRTTMQYPDDKGGIMHAELRRENVAIVVFSDDEGYDRLKRKGDSVGSGSYVALATEDAVNEVFTAAVGEAAEVIWEPGTTEWGNYRCRVADLEGYEWTFGTHRPGEPVTDEWSEGS